MENEGITLVLHVWFLCWNKKDYSKKVIKL